MDGFGSTVRFAYRSVRGSMATTLTVALTFSLAIGMTTAVFSIVYGVLQRPLPYPESDRLMRVWLNNPRQGIEKDITSFPNFVDWREQSRSFEKMVAVARAVRNLTGAGDPRELLGAAVSGGYFGLLRVSPVAGRVFTADEEGEGGANVVLLSHELWATQFGLDPHTVGRTLTLNDEPYEVVGVMPPGLGKEDFWTKAWACGSSRCARASWATCVSRCWCSWARWCWCSSSRARTSRTCCSRAVSVAAARWRFARRWARAAGASRRRSGLKVC